MNAVFMTAQGVVTTDRESVPCAVVIKAKKQGGETVISLKIDKVSISVKKRDIDNVTGRLK